MQDEAVMAGRINDIAVQTVSFDIEAQANLQRYIGKRIFNNP